MTNKITLQHIFNLAWQKFIVEKAPPAVEKDFKGNWVCAYLTEKGRKCVIGLCLPDGHEAQMHSGPFYEIYEMYPDLFDIKQAHCELGLAQFQFALHDDLVDRETGNWAQVPFEMERRYVAIAAMYDLTIPEKT